MLISKLLTKIKTDPLIFVVGGAIAAQIGFGILLHKSIKLQELHEIKRQKDVKDFIKKIKSCENCITISLIDDFVKMSM